jgi:hypothetical protein
MAPSTSRGRFTAPWDERRRRHRPLVAGSARRSSPCRIPASCHDALSSRLGPAALPEPACTPSRRSLQLLQHAPPRTEPLPQSLVREFVSKAHADFGATKTLLAEHPALLNATWDWGGGDFETGLGGASHMGSRDIAEFLIGQGARMDLFAAAMLGRLDIVTPMLTAYPALLQSRGPHGLSLVHHAREGGEPARAVLDYLGRLGAS